VWRCVSVCEMYLSACFAIIYQLASHIHNESRYGLEAVLKMHIALPSP
jgi:hypothetical protein